MRSRRTVLRSLGIGAALLVVGCGLMQESSVRTRAASDWSCARDAVTVEPADRSAGAAWGYKATGCNQSGIYRLTKMEGDPFEVSAPLRARAAFELSCPQDQLKITELGRWDIRGVEGCNQRGTYLYDNDSDAWVRNAGGVVAGTRPEPGALPSSSPGDGGVRP